MSATITKTKKKRFRWSNLKLHAAASGFKLKPEHTDWDCIGYFRKKGYTDTEIINLIK